MAVKWLHKAGRDGRPGNITVTVDGRSKAISESSPHYNKILNALKTGNNAEVLKLVDLKQAVVEFTQGSFEVIDSTLYYKGEPLRTGMANRLLTKIVDGNYNTDSFRADIRFLEKVMQNPTATAIDELDLFLQACDLPITDDGDFLAYKVVNPEYKDKHTGRMDNSKGATPKMPREQCDTNRDATCSRGLHFCSRGYLDGFMNYGDHLMIVKVNPANVTAIPSDHNNEKGRACEYYILDEITDHSQHITPYYVGDDTPLVQTPDPEPAPVPVTPVVAVPLKKTAADEDANIPINSGAKLTVEQVRKIRGLLANGWKPAVIAKNFGVHRRTVERIESGEAWKHVS